MDSNKHVDDKDLLKQVSEGDEVAFKRLYYQWQPRLTLFIFRITKSREITAEIVQDVFMKIWMNKENLSNVDNFKSYLFVACRNHALNALRKAMRELEHFQEWERNKLDDAETSVDNSEINQLSYIDEAIDNLSPRQKEIYLLHLHEGLTYQQIAEKLGIGKESVKTHLELAKKSITKYIRGKVVIFALIADTILKNI